jgi:hypothetical protein
MKVKLEEFLKSNKTVKEFLNEQQLKENGGSKGCVMLDLQLEKDYQLYWLKQNIPIENIYSHKPILTYELNSESENKYIKVAYNSPNEDLGYEHKEHCTVFYGLLNDGDLFKIKKYCMENYPQSFTLQTDYLHIFENVEHEECDCLVIKCKPCKELIEINSYIKNNFENSQTYNDYVPHITLAYIKKGTCGDLLGIPVDILFRVSIDNFVYSGHDKVLMENKLKESLKFNLKDCGKEDWNKKILGDSERFSTKIVYMSPDEFLDKVDYKRYKNDPEHVEEIKNSINSNTVLPTPIIIWGPMGDRYKSAFHDGQHRVMALKQLGIREIPVIEVWNREN